MHRIIPLIITLLSLIVSPAVSSAVTSRFGGFGGDFHVAPPQSSPSAPVASPIPLFYASVEQSDAWNTRANGFYSFAADGRGFTPVGPLAKESITVTDGAVYHDGRIYYLRKTVESLFRYSLDWTVVDAQTFEVISRTARNGLSLAFDMTYDPTTATCFAASPRSYSEPRADLRRVDLATGEFTTIAPLDVCIRAITADSQGRLWGLGNEVQDGRTVTFFYSINKQTGALTRIGDVGYTMQETDAALVCDLRDDCIYWAAHTYTEDEHLQRTYRRGLATIDTETGRATFLYDFPANEKLSSLIINTDHPAGFSDPTPLPVTDVQLTPKDNASTAVLTWTAPTECVDRVTPLDPSRLTYTVTRRNDGRIVASGLTTCRYEDTPDFPMQRVGYTITAVYTPEEAAGSAPSPRAAVSAPLAGRAAAAAPANPATTSRFGGFGGDFLAAPPQSLSSTPVQSPLFAIGRPHGIPYLETFDSYNAFFTYTLVDANADMRGDLGNGWFYDQTSQTALYYTTLTRPADDWLITPTLTLSPDRVYRLRFGTYGYMGAGAQNALTVALARDLGAPVQPEGVVSGCASDVIDPRVILTDNYATEPTSPAFNTTAQPRWLTVLFNPAEGEDRIAFHNTSGPADHMFIDNIYIEDLGPATDFDLDHLNDGPDPTTPDLDTFDDDVLRYVTDLRLSEAAASSILGGEPPSPSAPTLTWSPATTLPRLKPALQNCEALAPFTLDGGEGWTTYDADGARTIGIGTNQGALDWPHTTEPQAFIVFNPYDLGVQSIIKPHSGEQCFISFAAAGRASDDWLISPLLSGQKQRLKFWAKCLYPENLNEQFEVWASYDSPDIPGAAGSATAFRLAGPVTVSSATEWSEFSFVIPEGVRYVMIRCVSDSQFGLMIDDITFPAAPAPTEFWGYNVYCDGQLIARELPDCSFSLAEPMPSASASSSVCPPYGTYTVTAQYAEGESRHSNPVTYIPAGTHPSAALPTAPPTRIYDLQGRPATPTTRGITITPARRQIR